MAVSVARRIIAAAEAELGAAEQPLGSNRGPKVEEYQEHDWIPGGGYAYCVSFAWGYIVWHKVLRRPNPYPTASVAQLAAWAARNGWAVPVHQARVGDLICLGGGRHVTILHRDAGNGWFDGLGGNQDHRVKISRYRFADATCVIRVRDTEAPPPARKPRWEVVRGDGERTRVVYTGNARLALERVRRLVRHGRNATIRRRP